MLAHKLCYKPEIASRFYFACNHCWLKAFWETFVTMGHTPSSSISNTVHLYMKEMWFYIWCDYDYDIYVFINDSWMVFHIYQINDKLQAWDCFKVFFSFPFFHDLTLYVIIVGWRHFRRNYELFDFHISMNIEYLTFIYEQNVIWLWLWHICIHIWQRNGSSYISHKQ